MPQRRDDGERGKGCRTTRPCAWLGLAKAWPWTWPAKAQTRARVPQEWKVRVAARPAVWTNGGGGLRGVARGNDVGSRRRSTGMGSYGHLQYIGFIGVQGSAGSKQGWNGTTSCSPSGEGVERGRRDEGSRFQTTLAFCRTGCSLACRSKCNGDEAWGGGRWRRAAQAQLSVRVVVHAVASQLPARQLPLAVNEMERERGVG